MIAVLVAAVVIAIIIIVVILDGTSSPYGMGLNPLGPEHAWAQLGVAPWM